MGYNHDVKAKLTILVFWDPGCGHCKKVIPKLYELYGKYKSKGVEVYAVCTVQDTTEWKNYIKEHHLDWINVHDKYNYTNFHHIYDIYSTPVIYLLDDIKKILAKRLGVEDLEGFMERALKIERKP